MLKLKIFVVTILLAMTVGAGWVSAAGQAFGGPSKMVWDVTQDPSNKKSKEPPKEIKIPEARTDKVQLFQEQSERVRLEQQLAIEKFKASPEWKALEDRQKQIAERLVAELSSALRLAGVEEKDFDKYTYDQATLTFKRKAEEPKK